MSQDYIFNFSNGFQRPSQDQPHNQIPTDKVMRVQAFDPPPLSLVGLDDGKAETGGLPPVYETGAGTLSEMFNFPTGGPTTATELLENQINNQHHRSQRASTGAGDWYGNSAQPMQLFRINPPHESPSHHPSTLHMLLPNSVPSSNSTLHHQQSFGGTAGTGQGHFGPSTQFPWVTPGGTTHEGGALSLSLSSTLQQFESAKVEEIRIGDESGTAEMLYFNHGGGGDDPYRNLHLQGGGGATGQGQSHNPIHVGFGSSSLGVVKVLRNSRYLKAAQELLEEFCSVGRGQFTKNKCGSKQNTGVNDLNNPNHNPSNSGGGGGASSSSKDLPPLSSAEKIEHQRRQVKLLSMLDEVDRRYNHYCEQMQMVVNSFDIVMGFGAAVPYTGLAQKAMSRHFRCLKDAMAAQLKHSCELLGEKDAGVSGVTKGETPRLKILEQSLRQQRAFQQMGMMEQEAWRPQRGLPERSVNILRAWLFEHFLHPYPSDADKHLLARQTGLSKNQVSNWFINARVRLWKPMVEDMYQRESKEEDDDQNNKSNGLPSSSSNSSSAAAQTPPAKTSEINTQQYCFSENQAPPISYSTTTAAGITTVAPPLLGGSTLISFGPTAGDVSLTLGLRHAGNLPDNNNSFSLTDFGGY